MIQVRARTQIPDRSRQGRGLMNHLGEIEPSNDE
jgi:hypothetical protein